MKDGSGIGADDSGSDARERHLASGSICQCVETYFAFGRRGAMLVDFHDVADLVSVSKQK